MHCKAITPIVPMDGDNILMVLQISREIIHSTYYLKIGLKGEQT